MLLPAVLPSQPVLLIGILLCVIIPLSQCAAVAPRSNTNPDGGTVVPGSISDPGNGDAGSSGKSAGSVNLSNGGKIAIIVVVVIVVVLGITSTVLYFVAKKRQWEIRATIRRSARRLTGSAKPPIPPSSIGKRGDKHRRAHTQRPHAQTANRTQKKQGAVSNERRDTRKPNGVDLEKAVDITQGAPKVTPPEATQGSGKRWKKPTLSINTNSR